MKIILLQDTNNLGKKGEIKEVANGYARNYLLPQKIAVIATPSEIKKIEIKKQRQEKNQKEKIQKAEEIKKKIQKIEIEIKAKINGKGILFAALNKEEIAKALSEKIKQEILPEQIILEKSIKEIGEHKINIELFKDIKAEIVLKISGV
ncbi:50S ribosomal protein L9 [Candidatus Kuenenbacteria bacterium]|nr:50S ribosomal protein L9 [Candidatus Kuenenbacteria bacterium]